MVGQAGRSLSLTPSTAPPLRLGSALTHAQTTKQRGAASATTIPPTPGGVGQPTPRTQTTRLPDRGGSSKRAIDEGALPSSGGVLAAKNSIGQRARRRHAGLRPHPLPPLLLQRDASPACRRAFTRASISTLVGARVGPRQIPPAPRSGSHQRVGLERGRRRQHRLANAHSTAGPPTTRPLLWPLPPGTRGPWEEEKRHPPAQPGSSPVGVSLPDGPHDSFDRPSRSPPGEPHAQVCSANLQCWVSILTALTDFGMGSSRASSLCHSNNLRGYLPPLLYCMCGAPDPSTLRRRAGRACHAAPLEFVVFYASLRFPRTAMVPPLASPDADVDAHASREGAVTTVLP